MNFRALLFTEHQMQSQKEIHEEGDVVFKIAD